MFHLLPLLADTAAAGQSSLLLNFLIQCIALIVAAWILDGIELHGIRSAIPTAIILAIGNATLGKLLYFLATPFRWLSLGLLNFVLDAIIILIAARLLDGFRVKNIWWAIALAVIMSIISVMLHNILG